MTFLNQSVIDTHFHLTDDVFFRRRHEIFLKCRRCDISTLIVPAYNDVTCQRAAQIHNDFPHVVVAIGIHPLFKPMDTAELKSIYIKSQATFIGEIGLDRQKSTPSMKNQISLLNEQLGLAEEVSAPVIFHCVRAYEALKQVLMSHANIQGIIHRVSCSKESARYFVNRGFLFGIGPDILRDNRQRLSALVRSLPFEQIVIETDSPYVKLPNQKIAMPWDLHLIVQRISELKQLEPAITAAALYQNTLKLVGRSK